MLAMLHLSNFCWQWKFHPTDPFQMVRPIWFLAAVLNLELTAIYSDIYDLLFGFLPCLELGFDSSSFDLFFPATGTIDGKFDCGYLVSVKVGSEILNGVLYYPDQPTSSIATNQSCTAIIPFNPKPPLNLGRRNRRRRKRGGDPSRPKPNRSGYNFFFAEKHSALKSMYPEREREFTKMIGESWTNLSQEERMVSAK